MRTPMFASGVASTQRRNLIIVAGLGGIIVCSLLALVGESAAIIAALGVVALGTAVLAKPDSATYVYVLALYTNAMVIATQFHGVPAVVSSAFTAILLLPFASQVMFHRKPIVATATLPLMVVYLLVMLLSALVNNNAEESLAWIITFLTEGLLLYFLFTNVVRDVSTLRNVTIMLLVAGAFIGAVSIYQELTKTYSNNYWGFAQVRDGVFTIGENLNGKVTQRRLSGPIGEQNRFAQIMLVLIPLAYFQFRDAKSLFGKLLAGGAAVAIIGGMLLTFSRGALVSFALIGVFLVFWRYIKIYQAVLLGVALLGVVLVVAPTWLTRIDSFTGIEGVVDEESGVQADGAIRGRTTSNLAALYVFVDHPVLGVGPGQYYEQYSQKVANQLGIRFFVENRRAHNMYLETAADLGVVGLGVLMTILGVTLTQLYRARQFWIERRPELANLATTYFLCIIGYMATAVFLHLSYMRYFALLLGLANATIYILRQEAKKLPETDESAQRVAQYAQWGIGAPGEAL